MNDNLTECPNCGAKIKSGMMTSTTFISENRVKLINEFTKTKGSAFCTKCSSALLQEVSVAINTDRNRQEGIIKRLIENVPIASIHSPVNWDYEVVGIVTGQSSAGTGVFSEVASSFTDFFGAQSGTINRKLKNGEMMCMNQLRVFAVELGANAIIGVDIDYAEFGGDKGIVTVCMTGTAVRLKNIEIIGESKASCIRDSQKAFDRIKYLNTLNQGN